MLPKTVQGRLEYSFAAFGDNVAIEYKNKTVTYSQLNLMSDSVAGVLISKGVKKGTFIAVLVDDKIEFISIMIGILKAGCIFIPLDANYSDEWLEHMIVSTDTGLIIADHSNCRRLESLPLGCEADTEIIPSDALLQVGEGPAMAFPEYHEEDRIYVYFTSGSTGKPKAIVGKNKSLAHFINWEVETFGVDMGFRVSQFTSPGFDASLRDIFVPLFSGARICIPDSREAILETHRMISWIEETQVNLIHCTPSIFKIFNSPALTPNHFKCLRYILMAGESINPKDLTHWYNTFGERIQLVNLYGATETTMVKLFYPIQPSDVARKSIPAGKPMKGARVIVLDSSMNICSEGDVGEIYIRTPYMTFGYYRNPELNSEKFIPNPFSDNPDDLIYKTGDLGRFLPDGNLEFLGRIDRQVKIRGVRVELGGIESSLLSHSMVKQAAVVVKNDPAGNGDYLCAYVVAADTDGKSDRQEERQLVSCLMEYLSRSLPGYMIPRYIIPLEKMPITTNGKLDYKALPEPQITEEYIAPRDETESRIHAIWCEVLGIGQVGVDTSFIQAGGNSLSIMSLISRLYKEFGVDIPFNAVFEGGTIEKLAKNIKGAGKSKGSTYAAIMTIGYREYYPVSSAQKRLLVLSQIEDMGTSYNTPSVIMLEGHLDPERLDHAVKMLIRRHEALRTSFEFIDGEPVQRVHNDADPDIRWMTLEEYGERADGELGRVIKDFIRPFDFAQAPLFRLGIVKLKRDKHALMFDMHHIVSDDATVSVLIRDFTDLYQGRSLPDLRIQYKDFSVWQNALLETDFVKKQEEYWVNLFSGEIPVLNMPLDFPRPDVMSYEGDRVVVKLENDLCQGLAKLTREIESTLYIIMLAAYNVLLSKYTGQEDMIIGTPTAGRHYADLESVMGIFANTIALRNYPKADLRFGEFLGMVKTNLLKAYENQDYQFEKLVSSLGINRNMGRNPLFDTVFTIKTMNDAEMGLKLEGIRISGYEYEHRSSKLDLRMLVFEVGEEITVVLEYATKLYKRTTIEKMVKRYVEILIQIVSDCHIKLKDITISHDLLTASVGIPTAEEVDFEF